MADYELVYPDARQDPNVVDEYHGEKVPDAFRWMEDPDAEETKKWVDAQNAVTKKFFDEHCKYREPLKERLTKAYDYPKFSCTHKQGSHYYYSHNSGLQNQSVLYQQTALDAEPSEFLDPNKLSDDGTAALRVQAFSKDGAFFAYGVSMSGSDWQTAYVMETASKKKLDDKIEWIKFSNIAWTHDNKGFFYCRYDSPAGLEDDHEQDKDGKGPKRGTEVHESKNQKVYYHRLGDAQDKDELVFSTPEEPEWLFGLEITDDGKYLLVSPRNGCLPVNRLFYANIEGRSSYAGLPLVKLIDNFDAEYDYLANEGTKFWFKTNHNAPRYKVIAFDFDHPEQDKWEEVIPQNEDVLSFVVHVHNDKLVLAYMHHVKEILKVFDLTGKFVKDVDLPDLGSVLQLTGRKEDSEFFFMFASFVYPNTIFRCDCNTLEVSLFRETPVPGHDPAEFETKQVFYKSKDGTSIPMFLVSLKGTQLNGENPVFLYGYGGFSISLTPSFNPFRTVFIKSFGAVLAVPNIRGGGEYGEEWHQQAIKENRQVAFDDFCHAAMYLVEEKYTNPSKICISGGSNGGLLVSTCANQRPDLFRCVVSQVPVTDMFRFHKFTIGHAWCSDYGCSSNESEFKALQKYSPLHNVRAGVEYPAILVTTADHDDRVVPLHSLKYVATLQRELGKTNKLPLIVRVDTKAGHGMGKPTSKIIEEVSEVYGFIAEILKLQWRD